MNDDEPYRVVVTNIRMSFWGMVWFMVKWVIASIPAAIILFLLWFFLWGTIIGLVDVVKERGWWPIDALSIGKNIAP